MDGQTSQPLYAFVSMEAGNIKLKEQIEIDHWKNVNSCCISAKAWQIAM